MAVLNFTQVVKQLKCSEKKARAVLEFARIQPVFCDDNMKLYDRDVIQRLKDSGLDAYHAHVREQQTQRMQVARRALHNKRGAQAAAQAQEAVTLQSISDRLDRILAILTPPAAALQPLPGSPIMPMDGAAVDSMMQHD